MIHMDITKFSGIVGKLNLRKIKRELKAEGFINCKHSKTFRHVSLYDIAMAPYEETPYFPDGKGNEYNGMICRNVKGYKEREFIIVQFLAPYKRGCEDISTKKMLIFVK